MTISYLLTGVTGGLGAKVLNDMLHKHKIHASDIVATSRSEGSRARFESQGLHFRIADYGRLETLEAAFNDIDTLLFMSSSQRDTPARSAEHRNVIEAAKTAGVKKVWYVSLALGGYGGDSKVGFQQAHYATEDMLVQSGLDFVSLRAGIYTNAFPLALNWYPSSNFEPPVDQGSVAFTSRDELGEGIATLLAKGLGAFPSVTPQTASRIILLTGPQAETLVDIVKAIDKVRQTNTPIQILEPDAWIDACSMDDEGGKGRAWFEARLVWLQGMCNGEAELVDPALETVLGRRPETGTETIETLLTSEPDYYWHQNHVVPPKTR
ncbi:hypothetical protein BAUCODRAFT_124699 [Baudoinia panamericana UAMH 10762]|uniref:NAD(P)-binding domain-containing protein n=1 Tax=Baudoinia panamericana (strain UAMH 10762) TaxID=717646 RepID=M2N5B0_BAUPA|nr:uncharacterized protein BAUCODRAFT_124699 [Baudoinia panamericana UAMH 10762]EMC93950.1 hypothetical protein BAUCODRAFT_124699 [Baudoinia panamericana UAMH 10762]